MRLLFFIPLLLLAACFSAGAQTDEPVDSTEVDPIICALTNPYPPTIQGRPLESFSEWIKEHLVYPEDAWRHEIEGRVLLRFTIFEDGHLGDVKVLRGAHPDLDAEAVRVVESAPQDWTPGYSRITGDPVPATYICPVVFTLPITYLEVEEKPTFQGGDVSDFSRWFAQHLTIPNGICSPISGRILTEFTIDSSGQINSVIILQGLQGIMDKEALRVIRESPSWEPGRINGNPVPVRVQFPVYIDFSEPNHSKDFPIEYFMADVRPSFEGGASNDFLKWIVQNLVYPESVESQPISRILISFVIDIEGKVSEIYVDSGNTDLNQAVMELLQSSPRWEPGQKNGKVIAVHYTLPLHIDRRL